MQIHTRKYTYIYIVALFMIAAFTIGSQLFLQIYLHKEEENSHIINISGRQRMFSQKITKEALLILRAKNITEFSQHQQKLKLALNLWNHSHQGLLKGDALLNLPKPDLDQVNKKKFRQIKPYKDSITQASQKLIQARFSINTLEQKAYVDQILNNEEEFLKLMNHITFQFAKLSKDNITKFRNLEMMLMSVTLLLLGIEGFFIFRPTFKQINENTVALQENKEEIEAQNQMLNQVLVKTQVQNDNLIASIKYAQTIQNACLSIDSSISNYLNKDLFILFKPLQVVSGDFYYLVETESHYIAAAVDCQGHGIPGAFLSMIGVAILNDIVKAEKITEPNEILYEMHQKVRKTLHQEDNDNKDGMDISLISKPKDKSEIHFAGAKNPLVYIKNNELHKIKGDRFAIGGDNIQENPFTAHTITYSQLTMVYLFSDGYLDQFGGPDRRKFMNARFEKALKENYQKPLSQQKSILESTLENWMQVGNESQIDDILVMGIKFTV
ncbi:SpoIIE family protein phosphatase [Microscilla marina]|nr:SpoIIE family protein phosphatase [Microscilla marina]